MPIRCDIVHPTVDPCEGPVTVGKHRVMRRPRDTDPAKFCLRKADGLAL